ncbi:MAG: response regulator transcription factor [Candidatus Cloacimonetes bacterium]|jgi:two-component system alkaline phosphatase synthesis response regulator PhoP|nr:response regulator transcription factor [Candidatus Cloacimonadota bacterium]
MREKPAILIVEDEPDIRELIQYHLLKEGYETLLANNGKEALEIVKNQSPDLVLLDLMLPLVNGIEVLKTIRFVWNLSSLPIIIVSARTDETDIITALELGADNYLSKPFSPKVLVANVKALLRRALIDTQQKETFVSLGDLSLDLEKREAKYQQELMSLTATEFNLLVLLASHPGRVYTRNQLISGMRGDDYPVTERSIDVQIASLRKKLGDGGTLVKTVWGIGYSYQDKL